MIPQTSTPRITFTTIRLGPFRAPEGCVYEQLYPGVQGLPKRPLTPRTSSGITDCDQFGTRIFGQRERERERERERKRDIEGE